MYNNIIGTNYDANLKIKDIAKKVKSYIKDTYGVKNSVRSEYDTIFIMLKLDNSFKATSREELPNNKRSFIVEHISRKLDDVNITVDIFNSYLKDHVYINKKGQDMIEDIETYMNSFNYDKSDVMTDYFDYKFCGSVDYEWIE
ncbi:hypothetical protein HKO22_02955 [Peptoniphilus sp. AGMB00490]|uniref:Uncharacterized protein n=1 Tax=Peptoniphilus faecalis TaxID=2731255 RepID=A0A848RH05_9FIRM|nr:hypothetical protein [Peptoniphilus faecalis]NMW84703.1 hypothetical protein [Peptoniphilus faecalis]